MPSTFVRSKSARAPWIPVSAVHDRLWPSIARSTCLTVPQVAGQRAHAESRASSADGRRLAELTSARCAPQFAHDRAAEEAVASGDEDPTRARAALARLGEARGEGRGS